MNLINDAWIPAFRADGSQCKIAPWQIAETENPVTDLDAPRADFQGALYQFLIGLLQTVFAPTDYDEWSEYLNKPPKEEKLTSALKSISKVFDIDVSLGPAFMQERDDFGEVGLCPIEDLVGGELSGNTKKKNSDLFVKRSVITQVEPHWAALSLYNLQTSGVLAWGQHRVGLRGNGPLTTLILPTNKRAPLWESIWLNVIYKEHGDLIPGDWKKTETDNIFPWMGKTRISPNKEKDKTIPIDVNPLQHYWPMPRRIRLNIETTEGVCDITGEPIALGVKSFNRINEGVYYTDNWQHPLSPYRSPTGEQQFHSVILGKDFTRTFKDWPLVVTGHGEPSSRSLAALNIRVFSSNHAFEAPPNSTTIWCFGYQANKADVFGYIDERVPFLHIDDEKIDVFLSWVWLLTESSIKVSDSLCVAVSQAWYGVDEGKKKRNKQAINKVKKSPAIESDFYGRLRSEFFTLLFLMSEQVKFQNQLPPEIAEQWMSALWHIQQTVFDGWSLDGEQDEKKYRQIISAKQSMEKKFNSDKLIKDLKQIATSETEVA